MPARSEPLLWVQLIGAGVFPLEGLLLLLLLAGSDPGPFPGLERLLCWALGALAPTVLLWRRPADVWSLLLLQTPLRARRPLQQRLSRLQDNLGLRLGLAVAGAASLPLLWWLDEHAAVASSLSPLQGSPRLVALLLSALLLSLMLWQWQQLLQALYLLSRGPEAVEAATPMPQPELEQRRLSLGLPLLLLDPLKLSAAPAGGAARGGAALFSRQPASSTPAGAAPSPASAAAAAAPSAEIHAADAEQEAAAAALNPQTLPETAAEPVASIVEPLAADSHVTETEQDAPVSRPVAVEQPGQAAGSSAETAGPLEPLAADPATIAAVSEQDVTDERQAAPTAAAAEPLVQPGEAAEPQPAVMPPTEPGLRLPSETSDADAAETCQQPAAEAADAASDRPEHAPEQQVNATPTGTTGQAAAEMAAPAQGESTAVAAFEPAGPEAPESEPFQG